MYFHSNSRSYLRFYCWSFFRSEFFPFWVLCSINCQHCNAVSPYFVRRKDFNFEFMVLTRESPSEKQSFALIYFLWYTDLIIINSKATANHIYCPCYHFSNIHMQRKHFSVIFLKCCPDFRNLYKYRPAQPKVHTLFTLISHILLWISSINLWDKKSFWKKEENGSGPIKFGATVQKLCNFPINMSKI